MSIVALESSAEIPIGKAIVVDSVSYLAREYDSKSDTLDDVIGVSYPKSNYSFRISPFIDGPVLAEKQDIYELDEKLQYNIVDNNYVSNSGYIDTYNPITDTNTVYVCVKGFCSVEKGQLLPSSYKKVKNGVNNYDWYII